MMIIVPSNVSSLWRIIPSDKVCSGASEPIVESRRWRGCWASVVCHRRVGAEALADCWATLAWACSAGPQPTPWRHRLPNPLCCCYCSHQSAADGSCCYSSSFCVWLSSSSSFSCCWCSPSWKSAQSDAESPSFPLRKQEQQPSQQEPVGRTSLTSVGEQQPSRLRQRQSWKWAGRGGWNQMSQSKSWFDSMLLLL